jgi:hypothetical protein
MDEVYRKGISEAYISADNSLLLLFKLSTISKVADDEAARYYLMECPENKEGADYLNEEQWIIHNSEMPNVDPTLHKSCVVAQIIKINKEKLGNSYWLFKYLVLIRNRKSGYDMTISFQFSRANEPDEELKIILKEFQKAFKIILESFKTVPLEETKLFGGRFTMTLPPDFKKFNEHKGTNQWVMYRSDKEPDICITFQALPYTKMTCSPNDDPNLIAIGNCS